MVYLKEDGSLDVDRINALPFEEYMDMMGDLTDEQIEEYISKLPLEESNEPYNGMWVEYTMEEEIERGTGVLAEDFLNNLRKKYLKND